MAATLTTLLKNIKVNLNDGTNYAACAAAIGKAEISPVFFLAGRASPVAYIVPGAGRTTHSGLATHTVRKVTIYVVTRRGITPTMTTALVGESSIEGIADVTEKVKQALDRPYPYATGRGLPSGASYTAQNSVAAVMFEGEGEPFLEEDYGYSREEGTMALVVPLEFEYAYIETRSA